jgi:hypothetical protein
LRHWPLFSLIFTFGFMFLFQPTQSKAFSSQKKAPGPVFYNLGLDEILFKGRIYAHD